jgi:hypothetical protein
VEDVWRVAASVGEWSGVVVWTIAMLVACFATLLSLPGGWVALGLAILYDALHGFGVIGWPRLVIFAALLGVGELIEALLGSVYVAKKGASRWGVVGAFVGGIVGAILGTPVFPIAGTIAGGFLGAFAGAVLGEYLRDRRLEPSLRIGVHATIGKLLAVTAKGALAAAGAVVVGVSVWRDLAR